MLSFELEEGRFQFRAAAIIRRDGHLLIHRATRDAWWSLPGGRVELHEPSAIALEREIGEEMGCGATIGRLCFVLESFFVADGRRVQELAHYFAVEVSDFPFRSDGICHQCVDGDATLEFRWVPCDGESLATYGLRPALLRDQLSELPAAPKHLIEARL
jgi:8-oxo-dGTP pyrophosphatase MutT (NUDIX family)